MESKQRVWCWGFVVGCVITNIGYGVGWLMVKGLKYLGI